MKVNFEIKFVKLILCEKFFAQVKFFLEEIFVIEKIVGDLLREKNFTISCAESCTGGLLTSKLTDIAGSSNYVKGAIVSYTDEIKNKILQVEEETLKNFSAVSEETALEMSKNVRKIFCTDIGVSVTGYAGPGGEVGKVFISVAGEKNVAVKKFNFAGSRIEIKNQAATSALEFLENFLQSND